MQEAVRQQALQAMGVPVLQPRYQLPGAAASSVLAEPVLVKPVAEAAAQLPDKPAAQGVKPDVEAKASMAARVLALQAEASSGSHDPATIVDETEHPYEAASYQPERMPVVASDVLQNLGLSPEAKANLALLEAGRDIFIIDQVPDGQVFSKYQVLFLSDVLAAFDLRTQALKDEQLRWPPRQMAQIGQADQALIELLEGKIQALSPQLQGVIVLGNGLELLSQALAAKCESVKVVYSPYSSAQVMMNPEQKVHLWHSLQALAQWQVNTT